MKFTALVISVLLVLVLSDLPKPTLARRGPRYCGNRKGPGCNSSMNVFKRIFGDNKSGETGATTKTEEDREIEDEELLEKLRLLRDVLQELQLEEDERQLEEERPV